MSHFNPNIELSISDMELIEDVLHFAKQELARPEAARCNVGMLNRTAREIDDLLGHLHNQKVFYRPSKAPYVGG